MATVITVMNMKGGVGKTTVAAHLAGALAHYEFGGKTRKVLAIDYDAQFNLSQMFIPSNDYYALEKARRTSLAILLDDETQVVPFDIQTPGNRNPPSVGALAYQAAPRLELIPSTLDLVHVALGQTPARTDAFEERFRKFIDECKRNYDVIVIDCHPSGSILTKTALQNADHVLIPVVPAQFAARGIALMTEFIDAVKIGSKVPTPHILFNREGKHPSLSQVEIRTNPRYVKHCLTETLRPLKAFSDPIGGQGFIWYSDKPYSIQARTNVYNIVNEIVTRTGC